VTSCQTTTIGYIRFGRQHIRPVSGTRTLITSYSSPDSCWILRHEICRRDAPLSLLRLSLRSNSADSARAAKIREPESAQADFVPFVAATSVAG